MFYFLNTFSRLNGNGFSSIFSLCSCLNKNSGRGGKQTKIADRDVIVTNANDNTKQMQHGKEGDKPGKDIDDQKKTDQHVCDSSELHDC